jgi:prepilin-type N-terminal cleavage/methylation domain-containing protein
MPRRASSYRKQPRRHALFSRGVARGSSIGSGFTLVELLVTLAIIVTLISLMIPSLSRMKEQARRMRCASNVSQIGTGLTMWADGRGKGELPKSAASDPVNPEPLESMMVYDTDLPPGWDGLGLLFQYEYTPAGKIFYCPSHHGDHPYERYASDWANPGGQKIYCNYQYRVFPPQSGARLTMDLIGPEVTLLADGLRTYSDYNHYEGNNMLKADMSVHWYDDAGGKIAARLLEIESLAAEGQDPVDIGQIWAEIWNLMDADGADQANTGMRNPYWGYLP